MKKLFFSLVAGFLCAVGLAGPYPSAGTPFDLTYLPHFPGPWVVKDGKILDAESKVVQAAGVNLTGYACMPDTDAKATNWATRLDRMGVRVVRLHHIDWVLDANWNEKAKLDRFISALKKRKIPVMLDLYSERGDMWRMKKGMYYQDPVVQEDWSAYAFRLLSTSPTKTNILNYAREPYIVGITPVNEDRWFDGVTKEGYRAALTWEINKIQGWGYKGLIWGTNAGLEPGWEDMPGDVEDFHFYGDSARGDVWNTSPIKQPWQVYNPVSKKPLVSTEYGSLAPGNLRSESEAFFAGWYRDKGIQVALSFAYGTNESCWNTTYGPIGYQFDTDPVRVSTFRLMALAMAGGTGQSNWGGGQYTRTGNPFISVVGDQPWINQYDGQAALGVSTRSVTAVYRVSDTKLLIYRGLDAQNTGAVFVHKADQVWWSQIVVGTAPALMSTQGLISIDWMNSYKVVDAYDLDWATGKRGKRLPVYDVNGTGYTSKKIHTLGFWTEVNLARN